MNNHPIVDITTTAERLLSRSEETLPKKYEESSTKGSCRSSSPSQEELENRFLHLVPCFTLTKLISSCKQAERLSHCKNIMNRIQSLQDIVEKLHGITYSFDNISQTLKNIVDLSHLVVQHLNHTTRNKSISLPQEHHRHILQIIKNCIQIVTELENGSVNTSTVNWPIMSSALKSTIDMYKHMSDFFNSSILEHHMLRLSTSKMLEQMSQLTFHDT